MHRDFVDVAEKAHDPLGGRAPKYLRGRADLLEATVVHDGHAIGQVKRVLAVVSDQDRRDVRLVVEVPKPHSELVTDARVERPKGLVKQ